MSKDYRVYLEDMLEAITNINNYTASMTLETFCADRRTIDAVVRNLEIIGEATKRIPKDIKAKYYAVEWQKIVGLRNILIHQYFGIDLEIIWDIVRNKLPKFEEQIRNIYKE